MDSAPRTTAPERSTWLDARPFVGGLLVTLAGLEILVVMKAPLPVILHVGMQGLAGYLVPMVLLLCGILLIFSPAQRTFYSIIAAMLSLASWLTSNLGGFIFGLLLGLIGSALAFAWSPHRGPKTVKVPTPTASPADEAPTAVTSWMAGPSQDDGGPMADPSSQKRASSLEDADAWGKHRSPDHRS